jgi:hypothetical protein
VTAVSWEDGESRLKALGKLAHLRGRLRFEPEILTLRSPVLNVHITQGTCRIGPNGYAVVTGSTNSSSLSDGTNHRRRTVIIVGNPFPRRPPSYHCAGKCPQKC